MRVRTQTCTHTSPTPTLPETTWRRAEWGQGRVCKQKPGMQPYPCRALDSKGSCLVSLSSRREAGVSLSEIIPSGLRISFRIWGSR